MNIAMCIKKAMVLAGGVFALNQAVLAMDVSGVKMDDSAVVAGTDLKLNGAGVRYKAIFKVYAAGIYLAEKKATAHDLLAAVGPKRITFVMMREVSSEQFGQNFMEGMNHNSTKPEKSKIVNQMMKFGEMFASIPELKKGDMVTIDWIPGTGTLVQLNGKKIVEILPDIAFYNALLRIWLGDKPADTQLKQRLLGEKGDTNPRMSKEN